MYLMLLSKKLLNYLIVNKYLKYIHERGASFGEDET